MNFKRISAVFLKHLYTTKKIPERWFDMFYWPFFTLLFWWMTSKFLTDNSELMMVVIGSIMLWAVFYRSQLDINAYLLDDFDVLSQINWYASPLKMSELIAGTLLFGLARSFVMILVLVGICSFVFSISLPVSAIFIPIMFALLLFAYAVSIAIAGITLRIGTKIQSLSWGIAIALQPLSAVTHPLSAMPYYLQKIALLLPTTYVFEAFRQNSIYIALRGLDISIIYLIISLVIFAYFFRKALKAGTLIR